MRTAIQQDTTAELEKGLGELSELLERGHIEAARKQVSRLRQEWPESPPVRRLSGLLAPPRVVVGRGAKCRSFDRELAWLKEHAREHPRCWLAVNVDQLIAADPDYSAVLATARETVGLENVVVFFQP